MASARGGQLNEVCESLRKMTPEPPAINLQKRPALALAMLSSFMTPFMVSSINVALPAIGDEFSMSAVLMSWVAVSYLLAAAALLVPFGRIADIRGRKRIFLTGMWIFAVASILCAASPSSYLLIAFRVLQGVGAAMVFGTAIALLTSVYPPRERGKALGLTVSVTYIGLSAGPPVGGVLTDIVGWRSIFLVLLPIVFTILWIGTRRLKGEWAEACGERFDAQGSLIYGVSLIAVVAGFSFLPQLSGVAFSIAGVLGLVVFGLWELRVDNPVLDMKLFRHNRPFAFSNVAALINYASTFAISFLMSLYLQYVRGLDPGTTGLILVAQTVVMAGFSPLAGRLSDVVEPQVIASIGMTFTTVGLVMLAMSGESTGIWFLVLSLAVVGFGYALFSSPNTNAIMSSVDRKQYGIASATVGTMRLVGQVLSLGIATSFIAVYVGNVEITAALADEFMLAFKPALLLSAALCFFGIFASLARGKVRAEQVRHR